VNETSAKEGFKTKKTKIDAQTNSVHFYPSAHLPAVVEKGRKKGRTH